MLSRSARSRRRGTWVAALLLAASLGLTGCQLIRAPRGSSIRTENPWSGIDFVVRATSDGAVSYVGLAAGTDGLIRRSDLQPVATTVAVLDPVSCRVISEIALGAEAHVFVDIDTAGQVDTHPYDPSDYGTWPNIGALLPDAPQCASADPDPSSTAAPTPSIVDGVRLEPGAIDCQIGPEAGTGPDASTEPFDVRVEFVVGAVGGCVARDDDIRPGSADRSAVTIWNPDNDLHRLALAWDGTGCTVSATVSLAPTLAGYRADVISIDVPCNNKKPRPFGVAISVVDAIDAAGVTTTIDRVEEP